MMPVRPSKIIGIGRNYLEHARELGNEMPAVPILFFKPPTALIGTGDTILLPSVSTRVEFEAEIGVVIGKRVRNVDQTAAERAIGGFVCVNDVTCRDLQKTDGQWGRAKGSTPSARSDPRWPRGSTGARLELICRVNGVQRQRARSTDMAFSIPELISFLSGIMTLEPGDLIATGTPAGTAPLHHGDVVEVEIPGVGILSNPVRGAETP